jgi:hypothetical protein
MLSEADAWAVSGAEKVGDEALRSLVRQLCERHVESQVAVIRLIAWTVHKEGPALLQRAPPASL